MEYMESKMQDVYDTPEPSDTPRTDAAWKARLVAIAEQRAEDEPTMLEFARSLERENAAARATLTTLNAKVDELLAAIECAEQDIGHRPIADIIAELGPAYTDALVTLAPRTLMPGGGV